MTALVAGLGNVLLGDDGFGVEVARRLQASPLPDRGVRIEDFGVRAIHLAYALLDPYDAVILVDAMPGGAAPGTLFVVLPDAHAIERELPDGHALHPATVLRVARELGARLDHIRIVGCEPQQLEEGIGLSPPVEAAVEEAVHIVHELLGTGGGAAPPNDRTGG